MESRRVLGAMQLTANGSRRVRRSSSSMQQQAAGVRGMKAADRHSKVKTARGWRDRRVRLAAGTAVRLFEVQERLGVDQPSKAVDWLMFKAKKAIEELQPKLGYVVGSDAAVEPKPPPSKLGHAAGGAAALEHKLLESAALAPPPSSFFSSSPPFLLPSSSAIAIPSSSSSCWSLPHPHSFPPQPLPISHPYTPPHAAAAAAPPCSSTSQLLHLLHQYAVPNPIACSFPGFAFEPSLPLAPPCCSPPATHIDALSLVGAPGPPPGPLLIPPSTQQLAAAAPAAGGTLQSIFSAALPSWPSPHREPHLLHPENLLEWCQNGSHVTMFSSDGSGTMIAGAFDFAAFELPDKVQSVHESQAAYPTRSFPALTPLRYP